MTSLVAGPPSSENNFEPKIFIEFDRNKYSKLAFEIVPLFSYFVKVPKIITSYGPYKPQLP